MTTTTQPTSTLTILSRSRAGFLLVLLLGLWVPHADAAFGSDITDEDSGDPTFKFKWEAKSPLPHAMSDLTATLSDESGATKIYLVGGCVQDQISGGDYYYCPKISKKCTVYDPETDKYTSCADAPTERYRHTATNVNGNVWLVGGRDGYDNVIQTIDVYTPSTNKWATVASWDAATSDLASFADGSSLYVVGGYDQNYTAFATMTKIDTAKTISSGSVVATAAPAMKTARGDVFAAVNGGGVYITGGFSHEDWCQPLTSVERFDLASMKWTSAAPLGIGRGDKALVAEGGWLFAIGGEHNSNCKEVAVAVDDVEVYDRRDDTWEKFTDIPDERFRFVASAAPSGHIFIFGGQKYYDAKCDCFAVSDHVHSLEVSESQKFSGSSRNVINPWVLALVLVPIAFN